MQLPVIGAGGVLPGFGSGQDGGAESVEVEGSSCGDATRAESSISRLVCIEMHSYEHFSRSPSGYITVPELHWHGAADSNQTARLAAFIRSAPSDRLAADNDAQAEERCAPPVVACVCQCLKWKAST